MAVFIKRAIIGILLFAIFARHGDGRCSSRASLRDDGRAVIALIGQPMTCLSAQAGRGQAGIQDCNQPARAQSARELL